MDWADGAKGPQYAMAAANTEIVGRQLGILLSKIIEKGMRAENIHLIGFSLGAHVAGCASEHLKTNGHLIGRITGLDAASPLFKHNHVREKSKKLDKTDARYVDVIHTDASPIFTDGFGLLQPIGHVDFFPNGGFEQPGCNDRQASVVVSHFEKTVTKDIACSHVRAWQLFLETLKQKATKRPGCEFTAYRCQGGLQNFQAGKCFTQLNQKGDSLTLADSYRTDIGKLGEDSSGDGVLYLVTRGSSPLCGLQLQAHIYISSKTQPTRGVLQINTDHMNFKMQCELQDNPAETVVSGLTATAFESLHGVSEMTVTLSYNLVQLQEETNQTLSTDLYFNRIAIQDIYGNSWYYCGENTHIAANKNPIAVSLWEKKC